MDLVIILVGVGLGLGVGVLLGTRLGRANARNTDTLGFAAVEAEAEKIRAAAEAEAQAIKNEARAEGAEAARKRKAELDDDLKQRRQELAKREQQLGAKEREVERARRESERTANELEKKQLSIDGKIRDADANIERALAAQAEARKQLEQIANLSEADARKKLEEEVRAQALQSAAVEIKRIDDEAQREATSRAKSIIATAIQRFASEFVHERTVAVIPLPSDDLKGRLIGREGRNVRALEAATGVDLIIDDTAESITISCFNPVRREVARIAISALVADGRIHPTRIEDVVRKAESEVDKVCKQAGEQAVFDLGLSRIHPELVRYLGRLKFRQSYAQNALLHSIEVAYLAGLIAGELDANVKLARRAGLLHDIGKAVDHEHEGAHGEVGAQLARKHGESPRVCQAIATHHGENTGSQPIALLDHIVSAANALSAARPGARREQLASYIKRLDDLEVICRRFQGVDRAYALQSGREVRVMVMNDRVDDAQANVMAKEIARAIETEASYPGQVRVVVVRETRASDYAR